MEHTEQKKDARAAGLGAGNLSDMKITDTIKDAVDQQLETINERFGRTK